jgi:hypothetical protein
VILPVVAAALPGADGVGWDGIGPFAFQVGAAVQFHVR